MSRLKKRFIVQGIGLAILLLTSCFFAPPIDISGVWSGWITWTDGPAAGFTSPITLDLVHEDRTLSGTITLIGPGSQPFDLPITQGTASRSSLFITASGVNDNITPPVSVSITLEGEYDATEMSGTGSQTVDGNTYRFTFAASLPTPSSE